MAACSRAAGIAAKETDETVVRKISGKQIIRCADYDSAQTKSIERKM